MTSRSLIQTSSTFTLPLANMRNIFDPQVVEKKLNNLLARNHDQTTLLAVYEKMLERGPARFQTKPSGVPAMENLYEELPNFTDALDDIKRHIALSSGVRDGLEITPLLLLGKPGIGKTFFAKKISELIGTGTNLVSMGSLTAGWLISGSSSQWKGAKPGKVFEALIDGDYANPVIIIDEIDKAGKDTQYDPLGSLYTLLEHDTSTSFIDEFAEVPLDASQVIWIMTANDERCIPEPILNRMNIFSIEPPNEEQARTIALNLYKKIREEHSWGETFDREPHEDSLAVLAAMPPREMRRAYMTGFGNAKLAKRNHIKPSDLPKPLSQKRSIGF